MTNAMKAKHNQWMQILSTVLSLLADIFTKLKLPETAGKIKKEKHSLLPPPAETKY